MSKRAAMTRRGVGRGCVVRGGRVVVGAVRGGAAFRSVADALDASACRTAPSAGALAKAKKMRTQDAVAVAGMLGSVVVVMVISPPSVVAGAYRL